MFFKKIKNLKKTSVRLAEPCNTKYDAVRRIVLNVELLGRKKSPFIGL